MNQFYEQTIPYIDFFLPVLSLLICVLIVCRPHADFSRKRVTCRHCGRSFVAKRNGEPYKHKCINHVSDLDVQKELLSRCELELAALYENKESMNDGEYLESCNTLLRTYNQIKERINMM